MKTSDFNPHALAFSVPDAGAMIGVSRHVIDKAVREGRLPVVRLGGRKLIRRSDLQAMIDAATGVEVEEGS